MPQDLYTEFLHLPPGPRPPNHYEILALTPFEADKSVIHAAVLRQTAELKRWVLDPRPGRLERVQEMLNEVGRAGFILEDLKTKAEYDQQLTRLLGIPLREREPSVEPSKAPPLVLPAVAARRPRCPACGAAVREDEPACPACGHDARQHRVVDGVAASPQRPGRMQRLVESLAQTKNALILGLALAVLAIAVPMLLIRRPLDTPQGAAPSEEPASRLAKARQKWQEAEARVDSTRLEKREQGAFATARLKAAEAEAKAAAGGEKVVSLPSLVLDLGGGIQMAFVLIRPGSFVMGSSEDDIKALLAGRPELKEARLASERPARKVTIARPFFLGQHEVTQEQWQAVMGTSPSEYDAPQWAALRGPKKPVGWVGWELCQAFVKQMDTRFPGMKFRLPTEAEWEYACRAGSSTRFPFGDGESRLGDYAWFRGNSDNATYPVGEKKPNAWGLFDMQGNIDELCQDWFEDYPSPEYASRSTRDGGRTWTYHTRPPGGVCVLRGGSYLFDPPDLRPARRHWFEAASQMWDHGFRVALVAGPPPLTKDVGPPTSKSEAPAVQPPKHPRAKSETPAPKVVEPRATEQKPPGVLDALPEGTRIVDVLVPQISGAKVAFEVTRCDAVLKPPEALRHVLSFEPTRTGVRVNYTTEAGVSDPLLDCELSPAEQKLVCSLHKAAQGPYSAWVQNLVMVAVDLKNPGNPVAYRCMQQRKEAAEVLLLRLKEDGALGGPAGGATWTLAYPWPEALTVQHPEVADGKPLTLGQRRETVIEMKRKLRRYARRELVYAPTEKLLSKRFMPKVTPDVEPEFSIRVAAKGEIEPDPNSGSRSVTFGVASVDLQRYLRSAAEHFQKAKEVRLVLGMEKKRLEDGIQKMTSSAKGAAGRISREFQRLTEEQAYVADLENYFLEAELQAAHKRRQDLRALVQDLGSVTICDPWGVPVAKLTPTVEFVESKGGSK